MKIQKEWNWKDEEQRLKEQELESKQVYDGVLLQAYQDRIQLPDGREAVREYLKHFGAVCVIPVTEQGNVIMECQYRYAVGRVVREIPAGKLDSPEEDRLHAAKRELLEETGITADQWTELGNYLPAPAYSTEDISMYLATGLHYGERHLDEDEFLDVYEVPLETLLEEVLAGRITDGKSQIAILKAWHFLHNQLTQD